MSDAAGGGPVGYCPNCGGAVPHDGRDAKCEPCEIVWTGCANVALKPEPYAPGELEAIHAAAAARHPGGEP